MRINFVLFFHARKFEDPTSLFLSLQNEVILIVDSHINIEILTCQVKKLPDGDIFNLMPFLIMWMIENVFLTKMSSFKSDPSKRGRSPWFLDDDDNAFLLDELPFLSVCSFFFDLYFDPCNF